MAYYEENDVTVSRFFELSETFDQKKKIKNKTPLKRHCDKCP